VVHYLEFICDSPAVAFGVDVRLSNESYQAVRRTLDAWRKRTARSSKLAKREANHRNNLEYYKSKNMWATVAEVRGAVRRIIPFLRELSAQPTALCEDERVQYVNCLFALLLGIRGGRPGSIAGL
jgi:hypothetical protein